MRDGIVERRKQNGFHWEENAEAGVVDEADSLRRSGYSARPGTSRCRRAALGGSESVIQSPCRVYCKANRRRHSASIFPELCHKTSRARGFAATCAEKKSSAEGDNKTRQTKLPKKQQIFVHRNVQESRKITPPPNWMRTAPATDKVQKRNRDFYLKLKGIRSYSNCCNHQRKRLQTCEELSFHLSIR